MMLPTLLFHYDATLLFANQLMFGLTALLASLLLLASPAFAGVSAIAAVPAVIDIADVADIFSLAFPNVCHCCLQ